MLISLETNFLTILLSKAKVLQSLIKYINEKEKRDNRMTKKYFKEMKKRKKLFAKHSQGMILDIGFNCSPNPFLKGDVYGLDIVIDKHPPNYKKFVKSSCYETGFESNIFNTIIVGQTIEHLHNTGLFFKECARILKKDGLLMVSTMNPHTLTHIVAEWLEFGWDVDDHINCIGKYSLKAFYKAYGFKVIKTINIGNRYIVIGKKIE
jgi:SAM-dependent methyltransferase